MKGRFLLVVIFLWQILVFAFAGKESVGNQNRKLDISCLGDSITMGMYPRELQKFFGNRADVQVYGREGAGVGGVFEYLHMSLHLYARERNSIVRGKPTHVIWYAGINDCAIQRFSTRDQVDRVVTYVEYVMDYVLTKGIDLVLVQHHPWDASLQDRTPIGKGCSWAVNEWLNFYAEITDGVQTVDTRELGYPDWPCCYYEWVGNCTPGLCKDGYRIVCPEERVKEGCDRSWQLRDEYAAGDGLHLNQRGAKQLAKMIYEQVQW